MSEPQPTTNVPSMKRKTTMARRALLLAAGMILGLSSMRPAHAQARPEPPPFVSFQGTLVAQDGSPIGASGSVRYPMVFRIYDNDVGGRLLWSEQQIVAVFQGEFSVLLGEGSVFGNEPRPSMPALFRSPTASDRFVEVTVRGAAAGDADATVTPRTRLLSGAFSMVAQHARTAQNMVNGGGQPMLVPVGDKVGINKSNPQANLDVAETLLARALDVRETVAAGGVVEAAGFNGPGMAPVGSILMWTGATPPRGWVLCDGSVVAGVTTPDLRGRFVLGAGNGPGLTPRPMSQRGGEEAHALTLAEMPAHSHAVAFSAESAPIGTGHHEYRIANQGYVFWSLPGGGFPLNAGLGTTYTETTGSHGHQYTMPAFVSGTRGEGRPHNTMPPFYVLAFIMRVQ